MKKLNEMEIIKRAYENANDVFCQMEVDEIVDVLGTEVYLDSLEIAEKLQQLVTRYGFVDSVTVNSFDDSYTLDITFTHMLDCYHALVFEQYLYAKNDYGYNN